MSSSLSLSLSLSRLGSVTLFFILLLFFFSFCYFTAFLSHYLAWRQCLFLPQLCVTLLICSFCFHSPFLIISHSIISLPFHHIVFPRAIIFFFLFLCFLFLSPMSRALFVDFVFIIFLVFSFQCLFILSSLGPVSLFLPFLHQGSVSHSFVFILLLVFFFSLSSVFVSSNSDLTRL